MDNTEKAQEISGKKKMNREDYKNKDGKRNTQRTKLATSCIVQRDV